MNYAELHCLTNFSFLEGASHADELVATASELGYSALAVTDRNTLAGAVRAHVAAKEVGLKLIIGAEITLDDAPDVILWVPNRAAYGRLSRLITVGRRRSEKGDCSLRFADLAEHAEGLLCGVLPPGSNQHPLDATDLTPFRELFGDRCYLLAELHDGPDDATRLEQLVTLSDRSGIPFVAGGDVRYHTPARMPLCDVLTAIRHGTTVAEAGHALLPNARRHLQPIAERAEAFGGLEAAIERTLEVAGRCHFSLDELRFEYPDELAPEGMAPIEHLRQLVEAGSRERYPDGVPAKVEHMLRYELELIEDMRYEAYFLTVWDLVRFARSRNILCQGRGSAANSAVCYCLGVTAVDPATFDLLFERFISRERDEAPDIDVDFEHERREEVLQYLYQKYGRERAGLAATVITYRARSAVRDVGKALGLSLDRVDALAKQVDGYLATVDLAQRCTEVGIDPESDIGQRLVYLVNELIGFPRHLSQHVGGMVITQGSLCELAPIENAAMADRTVIQWDKNDLEALGILKVDCLCLGMLTAIHKSFDLIKQHYDRPLTLATLPPEDPAVYDMICQADTMGVFQIESRGQMSMLPRLKPRCYYDLVIEVAIVRPGPIQGQMVHPYLRRRAGEEEVTYPSDAIRDVLEKTMGVPIFQEQAMRLAVVAAGFTPGEADQLRRAMGAWRKTGVIEKFRRKLLDGMQANGLSIDFAERVYQQISGFGEYGFPESHAASFALLVYASAWLKRYYPEVFAAGLLNSQPMGFYAPAQLIRNAQEHGVEVRPIDVNHSDWDCTLEPVNTSPPRQQVGSSVAAKPLALRLGMRQIRGFSETHANAIMQAREQGPFDSIADFTKRTKLGQAVIARLADADAFHSLDQGRRPALWEALDQEQRPRQMPLWDDLADDGDPAPLPAMPLEAEVAADYRATGLSLRPHPLSFYREELDRLKVTPAAELQNRQHGDAASVAGLVLMRQRPATAKGITFVTLEDETGTANLVLHMQVMERFYTIARRSSAWIAYGNLQIKDSVIHLVVKRLVDLTEKLPKLGNKSRDFR